MRIALVAGAVALTLCSRAVDAQLIRGTLFDSLRTGAPVAGAEVVLFGTGRRDTTDAEGRFAFDDMRPGTHTVGYWAPWLDSLAVPALRATVDLSADAETVDLVLATPSRASAQRSLCGAPLQDGQSIVLGEVRDVARHPAAGAPVQAWWGETLLGVGQLERRTLATAASTDALGMFVLCGVPRGAELNLYAEVPVRASTALSATISRFIDATIVRQDLIVGPADSTMVVTGRLVGADTSVVSGAIVTLRSDTLVMTGSGADGTFQLRVPVRSVQLVIRAVGYAPHERLVEPAAVGAPGAGMVRLGDIRLQSLQELGAVAITGTQMTELRLAFEERRKFNFQGTFIDDEELARMPVVTTSLLSFRVPRSILDHGAFKLARAAGYCSPRIFIDGAHEPFVRDLRQVLKNAKRIEVYRAAFAPPRFNDFDGCGALVIWTR